ncbi:MAG: hypothetical protein LM591_03485 [Candidatus Korarchaeum sp.]|nr:hypothetical protein [Candidatus Korarchaeum sp.]
MDGHRALALVLSPVTVGLLAVLAIGFKEGDSLGLLLSIIFIVLMPIADVIRRYLRGEIDILVPERSMRGKFFLQASLSYSIGFILLRFFGSRTLSTLALTYLFVSLALMLINRGVTKISVHMAGITGPATFLLYSGNELGYPMILLIPILAWSRWKSGSHTIGQVILGILVSLLITLMTCSLLRLED